MRKFLLLIILGLGLVYADCSDGDEFNEDGYHCGDLQFLQNIKLRFPDVIFCLLF